MSYAEVAFNLPINNTFTYLIPQGLSPISVGHRVLVPFGKRTLTGIVVSLKEKCNYSKVKPIIDLLDEKPLLTIDAVKLAEWMAHYYMAGIGQALQLAIPKGLEEYEKELLHLVEEDINADVSPRQKELYELIANNPDKSKAFYRKKFGLSSFYTIVHQLKEKGLIFGTLETQKARVSTLLKDFVVLPPNLLEKIALVPKFEKYLERRPEIREFLLQETFPMLVSAFLKRTKMARATLHKMAANGIISIQPLAVERKPELNYNEQSKEIVLNAQQNEAIATISSATRLNKFHSFLLHGITGSGKTVVYIEILKRVIQQGKGGIILIPEIALTPQTVARFKSVFGEKIAVFHSKMSPGQRYDAWMACYHGQINIVIGPRSALFAPVKNLGLIVVDEEHEQSYKQTDTAPQYNARDVALYLAKEKQACVVLGSATPSFETFHNAQTGKHTCLTLNERATKGVLPHVHLADMRKEPATTRGRAVFSNLLIEKMQERLDREEQIILLQNRRGYASFQQCMRCGYIAKCNECEVSLTYHSYDGKLKCHYCGMQVQATQRCVNCGSDDLDNKGVGTQRIEMEIKEYFADARVLRMDQDTTRAKNAYDKILEGFRSGEAPILLGTQMISKGLDFPNVTLVGVISADVGLSIPDFRSPEKIFQLLSQVAGRAGRGDKPGEVVLQSYQPEHYAIQYAQTHNFLGFFNEEIGHRKNFNWPPFNRLINITVSAAVLSDAIAISREIAAPIRTHGKFICEVVGPAPAALSRLKNMFRWQVSIKINREYDPTGKRTRKLIRDVVTPHTKQKNTDFWINIDVDPTFSG